MAAICNQGLGRSVRRRRGRRPLFKGRDHALAIERLERRDLLYNLSGRSWDETDLSISFVPDGTSWEQGPAFTYQAFGQSASPDVWKETAARSFQLWANVTPLNFRFVADDGAHFGAAGDHGDIRVAVGESWAGAAHAILPELGEMSGEITFGANFDYDTRTTEGGFARLLVHEMGHSLGLLHEHDVPAAMRGLGYFGITADDIAGIQAIYGARQHDPFDLARSNDTPVASTPLNTDTREIQADLTSHQDVDYYRVVAPADASALSVRVDASRISFLAPQLEVWVDGQQVEQQTADFGGVVDLQIPNLRGGEEILFRVDGAEDPQFGMGAYYLGFEFSTVALPTPATPPAVSPPSSSTSVPPPVEPPRPAVTVPLQAETSEATDPGSDSIVEVANREATTDPVGVSSLTLLPSWYSRRLTSLAPPASVSATPNSEVSVGERTDAVETASTLSSSASAGASVELVEMVNTTPVASMPRAPLPTREMPITASVELIPPRVLVQTEASPRETPQVHDQALRQLLPEPPAQSAEPLTNPRVEAVDRAIVSFSPVTPVLSRRTFLASYDWTQEPDR